MLSHNNNNNINLNSEEFIMVDKLNAAAAIKGYQNYMHDDSNSLAATYGHTIQNMNNKNNNNNLSSPG